MEIYIVNAGTKRHHEFMIENNLKMMHLANSWRNPIGGIPYAIDNGAFHCYMNKKPFDDKAFIDACKKGDERGEGPNFIVCPDIVAGGDDSLKFSLEWYDRLPRDDYYLAVQDGMSWHGIEDNIDKFKGLFVGGTLDWKLKTAEYYVNLAHDYDLKCHIGRVGTLKRMLWSDRIGADSIDSSTFPQGSPDMRAFKRIIAVKEQRTLFDEGDNE